MYLEMIVQYFMEAARRNNVSNDKVREWALRRALATFKTWIARIEAELEKL